MPKYKVIALSVGTRNGVRDAGDIVTEHDFVDGHAKIQCEKGFLEEIIEAEKAEKVEATKEAAKPAVKKPAKKASAKK